jgi:hypothetical protein
MESSLRENVWKTELEKLEGEKRRIEREREVLMMEKNKETREW